MIFNTHSNLRGLHAIFSASQSYWLRYDDDKAMEAYANRKAAEMGSKLHEWAKTTIDLGIKQPRSQKTLYSYVNDAIGFQMDTEVVLFYSPRFFGTADAICFREGLLRIHDLKTGKNPVHRDQLEVYAALFCLEYRMKPTDIEMELRIYQNDAVDIWSPTADNIQDIMDKIVHLDEMLMNAERKER